MNTESDRKNLRIVPTEESNFSMSSSKKLEKFAKANGLISDIKEKKQKIFSLINSNDRLKAVRFENECNQSSAFLKKNPKTNYRKFPKNKILNVLEENESGKKYQTLSLEIENLKNKVKMLTQEKNNFNTLQLESSFSDSSSRKSTISDLSESDSEKVNDDLKPEQISNETLKQLRKFLFTIPNHKSLKESFENIFENGEKELFALIAHGKHEIILGKFLKLFNKHLKLEDFSKISEKTKKIKLPLKTIEQTLQDSSLVVSNEKGKIESLGDELDTVQANYSLENITQQPSLLTTPFETKQLTSHREKPVTNNFDTLSASNSLNASIFQNKNGRASIKNQTEVMPHLKDRLSARKSVLYNNQSLEKPRLPDFTRKNANIDSIPKKKRASVSPTNFNIITNN